MKYQITPGGPCMCGATDCPSCGPAQGYSGDEEYLEQAIGEIMKESRQNAPLIDDALGSFSDEQYAAQTALIIAALATEKEEDFDPKALQAIGEFMCRRVLEKLAEFAEDEINDIYNR